MHGSNGILSDLRRLAQERMAAEAARRVQHVLLTEAPPSEVDCLLLFWRPMSTRLCFRER